MSREFQVRPYQIGDEEGIVELLRQTFPDWASRETPLDYWRWKYCDNPNGSVIYIATSSGKIVGSNHTILLNIKVGNQTFKGRYGDDAATDLEYRGLGVYSKMFNSTIQELTRRGNVMNYEISMNPIIAKDHLKRGRKVFPHTISHMIKVKNVSKYFETANVDNTALKSYVFSFLKVLNRISSGFSTHPKKGEFSIEEIQLFDERIDTFYDRIKADYYFIVERNKKYLNWRYFDHRAGHYIVKQVVNGDEILGYSVIQIRGDDASLSGYIVDLLTLPGRKDVASALIDDACDYFDERGLNVFDYRVVKGNDYQRLASASGFIDIRSNFPLMMDCGTDELKKEFTLLESSPPSRAHFTYGDYY